MATRLDKGISSPFGKRNSVCNIQDTIFINLFSASLYSPIFHSFCDLTSTVDDYIVLAYDVASRSEITPCNKICKPLVVYRFTGNVITSITSLRT